MFFFNNTTTEAEKQSTAAVKAVWKQEKSILKNDITEIDRKYKDRLVQAAAQYEQAKKDAKTEKESLIVDRVQQSIKTVNESEAMMTSEPSVKVKAEEAISWIEFAISAYQSKWATKVGEQEKPAQGSSGFLSEKANVDHLA